MKDSNTRYDFKPAAPAPKLDLKFLPGYAAFLLQNHLEAFVKDLIRISREEEVPLLKFFD
jgi:hypothetical protein